MVTAFLTLSALAACGGAKAPPDLPPQAGCADQGALAVAWSLQNQPSKWKRDNLGYSLVGPGVGVYTNMGQDGVNATPGSGGMFDFTGYSGPEWPVECRPVVWRAVLRWAAQDTARRVRG